MNKEQFDQVSKLVVDKARLSLDPMTFDEHAVVTKVVPQFIDYAAKVAKIAKGMGIHISVVLDAYFELVIVPEFLDWFANRGTKSKFGLVV